MLLFIHMQNGESISRCFSCFIYFRLTTKFLKYEAIKIKIRRPICITDSYQYSISYVIMFWYIIDFKRKIDIDDEYDNKHNNYISINFK